MLLHLCYTSMQMGRVFQHFRPVNIIRIYIYIFFFSFEGFEGNGTLRVINFSRAIFARKSRYLASIFSRIEMSRSRIIELVVDKETKGWGRIYTYIFQFHRRSRHLAWTRVYTFFPRIIRYRGEFYVPRDTERKPTSREQIIINWRIGFVVG